MALSVWASFVGLSFLYCLLPGPSVWFTIGHSLRHGPAKTSISILGQLAGNALYIALACLGLGGLVANAGKVFQIVKFGGAAYIVYLGIRLILSRDSPFERDIGSEGKSRGRCFLDGFAVCGLNPKTLVYYAALLPQFVLPRFDKRIQLVLLGLGSMAIAFAALMIYSLAAERARLILMRKNLRRYGNTVVGSLFILAGLMLGFL